MKCRRDDNRPPSRPATGLRWVGGWAMSEPQSSIRHKMADRRDARSAPARNPFARPLEEMEAQLDTFPRLLLQHAAVRPGHPATREKDLGIWQTWTWRDVADEVRALACGLAAEASSAACTSRSSATTG